MCSVLGCGVKDLSNEVLLKPIDVNEYHKWIGLLTTVHTKLFWKCTHKLVWQVMPSAALIVPLQDFALNSRKLCKSRERL